MKRKKVLIIVGTRPDAIKSLPVYMALKADDHFEVVLCSTAQHTDMLLPVFNLFNVQADIQLNSPINEQSLDDKTSHMLKEFSKIMKTVLPDWVLVQGDTLSSFCGALSAFHHQIKIGHIEAGLRSFNKYAPFPEEMYRVMIDEMADLYFCPTAWSKENLLKVGKTEDSIFVTGNTGIDALLKTKENLEAGIINLNNSDLKSKIDKLKTKKLVLLTLHRREILGDKMKSILEAIGELIDELNLSILFPVHKNPKVLKVVNEVFGNHSEVHLIEPLVYQDFIYSMMQSDLIISDSGGIQEEAPTLGKKLVVIRDITERPEGIELGNKLAGLSKEKIKADIREKLLAPEPNPSQVYGDGTAALQIKEILKQS